MLRHTLRSARRPSTTAGSAATRPSPATASSRIVKVGERLAAQGRCGPGPGPLSRATPTPARCRSHGGPACGATGRSGPTPRTGPGSRPPPRPGARGWAVRPAWRRRGGPRPGGDATARLAGGPAPAPRRSAPASSPPSRRRRSGPTGWSWRRCRLGLGSGRSTPGRFSPQGRQLDRLLHDRRRQPHHLGPKAGQLGRLGPVRLGPARP